MTWEIAFTVVGCLWALVVLYTVKDGNEKDRASVISELRRRIETAENDIDWLKRKKENG